MGQVWFLWQQSLAIRADHVPSLFLNYPYGVFYPHFAFYGGTLYALAGTLSLALGNAPIETYVPYVPAVLRRRVRGVVLAVTQAADWGAGGRRFPASCSSPPPTTSRRSTRAGTGRSSSESPWSR